MRSDREKKLLIAWPFLMVLGLAIYFWPESTASTEAAARFTDVPTAELRLTRLRQMAASIPAREKVLADAQQELAGREKGLVTAPTSAQQQAGLVQTVRRIARAQGIDFQQVEIGQITDFGVSYSEAPIAVSFTCRIEQLVNLVAEISAQKELVATRDLQVRTADDKRKTVSVRMTVSAVMARVGGKV